MGERYIVRSVRDRVVHDATEYSDKIDEEYASLRQTGGNLKFVMKTGDGADMDFNYPITQTIVVKIDSQWKPRDSTRRNPKFTSGPGVNVWIQTGGGGGSGGGRDNPDE